MLYIIYAIIYNYCYIIHTFLINYGSLSIALPAAPYSCIRRLGTSDMSLKKVQAASGFRAIGAGK